MFTPKLLLALYFAIVSTAYQIISPGDTQNWSNAGPQTVSWERVETDPETFTIVLTNEDRAILPTNNVVLAEAVDGATVTSTTVNPPSGGWPIGAGFVVNFMDDQAILAQSGNFDIASSGSGSSNSATAPNTGTPTGTGAGVPTRTTLVASSSTGASSTGTASEGQATTTNGALPMSNCGAFSIAYILAGLLAAVL